MIYMVTSAMPNQTLCIQSWLSRTLNFELNCDAQLCIVKHMWPNPIWYLEKDLHIRKCKWRCSLFDVQTLKSIFSLFPVENSLEFYFRKDSLVFTIVYDTFLLLPVIFAKRLMNIYLFWREIDQNCDSS